MSTNSPNIKTISEKHGAHLKASFVRIRWTRNIRPFLWTWVSRYREIKISQKKIYVYFTQIGPSLANSIDIANKATFDTYLKLSNSSSFQFQYTDAPSVQKIINNSKPKSSAGHDNISSRLLRDMGDIVAYALSIIINQSLCIGVFQNRLKLAKVITLY